LVELEAVLVDVLVFGFTAVYVLKFMIQNKMIEDVFLHPHEIAAYIGGFHFQPGIVFQSSTVSSMREAATSK